MTLQQEVLLKTLDKVLLQDMQLHQSYQNKSVKKVDKGWLNQ